MAKTGLTSSLLALANKFYEKGLLLQQTELGMSRNDDIKQSVELVRYVGKSKDISEIVNIERLLLHHERDVYGKDDAAVRKSFDEAIKELNKAVKVLPSVYDKDKYTVINDGISDKAQFRKDGLPKDSFHIFVNSHRTRLSNRIRTAELSFDERRLLEERHSNIKIALNEYMKLQTKALDIFISDKSKEK